MLPPAPLKKTEESSGLSLLPPPPKKEVSQPSIKAGNRLRTDTSQPEQIPTTEGLKPLVVENHSFEYQKLNPFNNAKPEVRKQKRDYLTESMKVDVTDKPVSTQTQAPIDPIQQQQVVERGKVEEKAKNLVYQEATSNKRVDLLDDNVDAKTYGDAAIEDYFEVEKSLKMPNQEDGTNRIHC